MNGYTGQVVNRHRATYIDRELYDQMYPEHSALMPSQEELHAEWRAHWRQVQNSRPPITEKKEYHLRGKRRSPRVRYSQAEIATICQLYPAHGAAAVLEALGGPSSGRNICSIRKMANDLGLHRL